MPRLNVFPRFRQWWVRRRASDWRGGWHWGRRIWWAEQRDCHESDDGHRVASIIGVLSGSEQLEVPQFFAFDGDWRERYSHGWVCEQRQPDDECERRGASRC
jgi:hypothetical protein